MSQTPPSDRRLRLLIVEDSEDDALLDAIALEDAGYKVESKRVQTRDGLAAALEERRWDIVLCDHSLPGFDSFGALDVLAGARRSGPPLIVVSGAIGEETAAAVIRAGAADFVNKSNLNRLSTVVATVLRDARTRRAAIRAQAQFRSAFDDAAFGSALIALGPRGGRLLRVNRALCGATGMSRAQLRRTRLQDLVDRAHRPSVEHVLATAGSPGTRPFRAEVRFYAADGATRWFLISLAPVNEPDDERPCAVAHFIDITARKRAEEELERAHRRALDASRMKSEFMANVSHEIRTPLNGVIGLTELLAETTLSAEQREYLSALQTSGQALMAVIEQVLDFSKIEAGKVELTSEPFKPRALVERAVTIVAAAAAVKGLTLTRSIDPAVPESVCGDSARLLGVLTNLLSNAVKFTDLGGEVSVTLTADPRRAGIMRFEVADTGIGIESDVLEQIFRPFSQADASTSRRYGGTGLGLTIANELVSLMGGTISVESAPGVGSTFSFELPFTTNAGAGSAAAPAGLSSATAAGTASVERELLLQLDDERPILLVEDDRINQLVAERMLAKAGYPVVIASDGHEAVSLARAREYRLIFMDCQMPGLDGYEATRAIRAAEGAGRHTPIVAMTAHAMPGAREECLAAGMDDYIAKPLRREDIESCLSPAHLRSLRTSSLLDRDIVEDVLADGGAEAGVLELFLEQSQVRLTNLKAAVLADDRRRVSEIAHSITGSCATFGARAMATAARRLCDRGTTATAQELSALAHELERLVDPTHEALVATASRRDGDHARDAA